MGTYTKYDYDFSDMTLEQGKEKWIQYNGVIKSIGYGYTCKGSVTSGQHWTGVWINSKGMGNHGDLLIKPVSPAAKEFVAHNQALQWSLRYGVSYKEAKKIYFAPFKHKHELIADICAAILDDGAVAAFASFPGVGPHSHLDWLQRWGNIVTPYLEGKSWPRIDAMIEIVNFVASSK